MREGPYTKIGAVAGVLSVAIALIVWALQPSAPAHPGPAPSSTTQSTQSPPAVPSPSPVPASSVSHQAKTAPTSIAGNWNGSDGVTYKFVPSGNGPGSYRGEPENGPACGPNNILVTDQGHGLYSDTETAYTHLLFGCDTLAPINVTIQIAANGESAVFKSQEIYPSVNLVRSGYQP